MRGELDWIVMKALEKDRNRRYETANGFAMDVQRYLADEPVLACPPSAGYRMRKFARRHRAALWTTGVVALALVVGTAVSVWQAVRATRAEGLADARLDAERRARQDADTNFQTARKAVDDYFTVVAGSSLLDAPVWNHCVSNCSRPRYVTTWSLSASAAMTRSSKPMLLPPTSASPRSLTWLEGGLINGFRICVMEWT